MLKSSPLTDTLITETLLTHYGLSIQSLSFLPIGNDSATFVYRVVASDDTRYFLKVRIRKGFNESSISIPRFLFEQGTPHIVMPLTTLTRALWVPAGEFVIILYPFLEAKTARETGLSDLDWTELGATLRQIHISQPTTELQARVPRETYIPWRRHVLDKLDPIINRNDLIDPAQLALQAFWRTRETEIRTLIVRSDHLASQLQQKALPLVLCHADLHTWNVLVDATQQIWIVDWDEVMLAPKERDLMFVIQGIAGGLVSVHQTACFLRGYGETEIDQQALTYYRYAWAVQEMGAYAEEVFFSPERGEAAGRDAVEAFISVFAPGNIASIALASEVDPLVTKLG